MEPAPRFGRGVHEAEATITADFWNPPMNLQFLDFDCSEDAEGVVSWDALAQPSPRHNEALLHEVAQVLVWAHDWTQASVAHGPGPLDDGADWDYDLQATLLPEEPFSLTAKSTTQALAAGTARLTFDVRAGQLICSPPPMMHRLEVSLSLSGTPGFAKAFREHWGAP